MDLSSSTLSELPRFLNYEKVKIQLSMLCHQKKLCVSACIPNLVAFYLAFHFECCQIKNVECFHLIIWEQENPICLEEKSYTYREFPTWHFFSVQVPKHE